ncbi:hypothetical protein ABLT31_09920 [Ammoniphilus sp. 3BR4]
MDEFTLYLNSINDIEELNDIKEEIKNQVINSEITWQERIELYRRVRSINLRIKQLEDTVQP